MIVAAFLASMVGAFVGRVVADAWIEHWRSTPRAPSSPAPSSIPVALPTTPCLLCLAPIVDPLTLATCPQPTTEVTYADRPVVLPPL
jgi:hypothetical protein